MHTPTANYAAIESAQRIDGMAVSDYILQCRSSTRFLRYTLRSAVNKPKETAEKRDIKNMSIFKKGDRVLLSNEDFRYSAVTNVGASKFAPCFIGPFTVHKEIGDAYTLDVPSSLRLNRHSTSDGVGGIVRLRLTC